MKMLTIVITYYNIQYFEQTLGALAAQTDKRFVVFVGNDASPDDPSALLEQYKDKLNIKYLPFSQNLGGTDLTLQWKRCLDYVDTEWFMILGDDDMLSPGAISGFYETIQEAPEARVLRYDMTIVDGNNHPQSGMISYKELVSATEFIYKRARNEVRSSLGEYIFRTEDYRNKGIASYPKAFYSDNMMVLQYANFGVIQPVNQGYAIIRISENSFSGNKANADALVRAGYLFYTELMTRYAAYFTPKQHVMFAEYVLAGYLSGKRNMSPLTLLKIFFRNLPVKDALHFSLKWMKNSVSAR